MGAKTRRFIGFRCLKKPIQLSDCWVNSVEISVSHYIISNVQFSKIMRYTKKQEGRVHTQEKRQPIEIAPKKSQMLVLLGNDLKTLKICLKS